MSLIARERLGPIQTATDAAHADLGSRDAVRRMRAGDHTLWQEDPTEVADRLGWLAVVDDMRAQVPRIVDLVGDRTSGALMGMGGSSLFPEVLNRTFPSDAKLSVLDTTDPAAIARVGVEGTTFIAASKSGTTIETTSQLEHFWNAAGRRGEQFVAITDPGTDLAELGKARSFRGVFESRPDIGGRFSALSHFGLVPGAMLGVDCMTLLDRAEAVDDDDGARLAAVFAASVTTGRNKLTIVLPDAVSSFGLWIEQLVAESTGKHGTGMVPVTGEPLGALDVYGDDRLFVVVGAPDDLARARLDALASAGHPVVEIAFGDAYDLGAQVLLWEMAVALSAAVFGINPFDQPDVQAAKDATNRVLTEGLPEIPMTPLASLVESVRAGDYLCIQAFVDPGDVALLASLERARIALRDRLRVATTLGVGPRFLHSTGQLHKGGPPTGVFVQVVGDDPVDVPIPGRPFGFSFLKQAQAAGDLLALRARGLRAGRVSLDALRAESC